MNYSRQREAILKNLLSRNDHPTAEMIYTDIRGTYPNISLGTVYRNLAQLCSQKKIIKLPSDDGGDRYDRGDICHSHFICRNCGAVTDIFDDPKTVGGFPENINGIVERCQVIYHGLCGNCRSDS